MPGLDTFVPRHGRRIPQPIPKSKLKGRIFARVGQASRIKTLGLARQPSLSLNLPGPASRSTVETVASPFPSAKTAGQLVRENLTVKSGKP